MARLLVNKHFTKHNEANNGFTNVEDYAFGEIIICNDKETPSIYIKDADNNSVAISNVKVSDTDKILSLEDNKLSAKISMVWDSVNNKIKLLGKTKENSDVVLSEIEIFNADENGIGDAIDNALERTVDVTLFTATDDDVPAGTTVGQTYLKVETISDSITNESYIPFLTIDKLFTIEGDASSNTAGKITVTKHDEDNKYVISHGKVSVSGNSMETPPIFGKTSFISEIGVNELGHVESYKTGTLPILPSISITSNIDEFGENQKDLYISQIEASNETSTGLEVKYSQLPKVDISASVTTNDTKNLTFISNIEASGSTITAEKTAVNLDGYAKAEDYYDRGVIDEKLKNIIDPDGELIVPPVQITGNTTEEGKYLYNITVNEEGVLELQHRELNLDNYLPNSGVTIAENPILNWDESVEVAKINNTTLNISLPEKPGIDISTEESTTGATQVIVGIESTDTNTADEALSLKFKTIPFAFDTVLTEKDIIHPETGATLDWNSTTTIATIGETNINVKMPSPINVSVTETETETEFTQVITNIGENEHGITVTTAPFSPKSYITENNITGFTGTLPWGTKDSAEKVNTTTIATIGGTSVNVALPEKPIVGMLTGTTTIENPQVVTEIEVDEDNNLVVKYQDALPKDYLTANDLATYLDVNSIKVKNGTTGSTGNTFVTSITTATTEEHDVEFTVNYGNHNIDGYVTVENDTTLEWGTSKDIFKIGDTTISIGLPVKPETGAGADGNTLYLLSGTTANNDFKVELLSSTDGTDYNISAGSATLNLSNYLTSGNIGTYIPVKDVKVNKTSVVDTNGVANITIEGPVVKADNPTLNFGESTTIATIDGTVIDVTMPDAPAQVETKVDDVQINGATIIQNKIANIQVVDNSDTLAWNTSVEIAKIGGISITATLPEKPAGDNGVTDTTYTLSGETTPDSFKITLTGSDSSRSAAELDFSEIPFNETTITTGKTGTGGFVKNITFSGDNNHTVNVEFGDPDLAGYSKTDHIHPEYVNQSAFKTVQVGNDKLEATIATDTITIQGSEPITVSGNTLTKIITIGFNDSNYVKTEDFHDTGTTIDGHYDPLASLTEASLNASGSTYISGISFDKKKHITGITTSNLPTTIEVAKKLDIADTGDENTPVYFASGIPQVCTLSDYVKSSAITQDYLTGKIGDYYLTGETYKGTVTDVKTFITNNSNGQTNVVTTNGNTYLNTVLTENNDGKVVSSHNIKGSGSVSVSSDANGNLTISGTVYQAIGNYLTKETYLGTISGITVGSGLTGGGSVETGSTEVTIKPNLVNYNSLGEIGEANKLYAVGVDKENKLCVNVPWVEEKNKGTVTSVELRTGSNYVALTGNTITENGAYTFDLSETTKNNIANGLTAFEWGDHKNGGYWIPATATTAATGIVKLVTGDMKDKTHTDGQVPSLNHTHSQYLTSDSLNGYATQQWVGSQNYLKTPYSAATGLSLNNYVFSLNTADTSEIGGIKAVKKTTSTNDSLITTNDSTYTKYGVIVNGNGQAYVSVANSTEDRHYNPSDEDTYVGFGNKTLGYGESFYVPYLSFDSKGHYISVTANTVTLPQETHYETNIYVGNTETSGNQQQEDPYLKVFDDTTFRNQVQFKGSGATSIESTTSGEIIIGSTDKSVTSVKNHYTPSGFTVTKEATGGKDADITNTYTSVITGINLDDAGHVYSVVSKQLISRNTDTHYTSKNIIASGKTATGQTLQILNNDNIYLNHIEESNVTSSVKLYGKNGINIIFDESNESLNFGIDSCDSIDDTITGNTYPKAKAVYDYVEDKLTDYIPTDKNVESTPINDNNTKAYLLATSTADTATGTALKSTSIFMSANTLTAEAFYQSSDERLKNFCEDIGVDFEKLKNIPKSYFTWKSDDKKVMQIGTSAQKVKELYPELIGGTEDSLTVDYAKLSIVALKAIDVLHEENEKLKAELDVIKKHLGL